MLATMLQVLGVTKSAVVMSVLVISLRPHAAYRAIYFDTIIPIFQVQDSLTVRHRAPTRNLIVSSNSMTSSKKVG